MFNATEYTSHVLQGKLDWVHHDPSYEPSKFSVPRLRDIAEHIEEFPNSTLVRNLKRSNEGIVGEAKAFLMQTEKFEEVLRESGKAVENPNAAQQYAHETAQAWEVSLKEFDNKIARFPKNLQRALENVETKLREVPAYKQPASKAGSFAQKLEEMSGTKMAVIGGAVALGVYVAYKVFNKEHPEHAAAEHQR